MTLKKLTDAIAGMTAKEWKLIPRKDDVGFVTFTDTLIMPYLLTEADAHGIALLRNVADELVAVCEAASILRKFLDEEIGMDKTELTMLRVALAQLEKKLGEM